MEEVGAVQFGSVAEAWQRRHGEAVVVALLLGEAEEGSGSATTSRSRVASHELV